MVKKKFKTNYPDASNTNLEKHRQGIKDELDHKINGSVGVIWVQRNVWWFDLYEYMGNKGYVYIHFVEIEGFMMYVKASLLKSWINTIHCEDVVWKEAYNDYVKQWGPPESINEDEPEITEYDYSCNSWDEYVNRYGFEWCMSHRYKMWKQTGKVFVDGLKFSERA